MSSEADLRHAISMRPHPFHTHPHSRSESPAASHSQARQDRQDPTAENQPLAHSYGSPSKLGHSTAFEATTPDEDERADPIARHARDSRDDDAGTLQGREGDIERQTPPRVNSETDPYNLAQGLKSEAEIQEIKANTSRKRGTAAKSTGIAIPLYSQGKDVLHARKIQNFYESQNENIERLLKPVDDHRREAKELEGDTQLKYKIAVTGSFIANCCLAILQIYGAASSGSLALFTTMADSIFDPASNISLILCNRAVKRVDPRKYPSGKARIETAGNIFFCFLMTAVSLIIIVQSCMELAEGSETTVRDYHLPAWIAVAIAFVTKLCLFLYCFALRNIYSQVRILWEDHRNDLLINGVGLAFSVMGSFVRWWIDPMGAIILSLIITVLWLRTAYSEFMLLIGVSADTSTLQLITYVGMFKPLSHHRRLITHFHSSHDTLSSHHRHRHRARLPLRPTSHRRSRHRHGRRGVTPLHARCRRGAADQAREPAAR
jgi:divalent metal cation (Fe/Co/Zn/Cd) transporter